jgi:hypothetical protein
MNGADLSQLSEDELVTRASSAMARAIAAGPGTLGWAIQWAVYDEFSGELDLRAAKLAAGASPDALHRMRAALAAAGLDKPVRR